MKPSHPKMTSEDNSRAFILNFSGGYTRPTIDSMFDSDDESFSPASSLKTPENEIVDDIDPDDIPSILDGLNSQNLNPKNSAKLPEIEMENDDSNSNQYDEALLTNSFATPTPRKRQRKGKFFLLISSSSCFSLKLPSEKWRIETSKVPDKHD
jgi:hypothetical protein